MKRSLVLLTIATVSMLALTGCPDKGSDKNPQPVVQANVYNVVPNESCNVPATYPGTYTCTQNLNGTVLNTVGITYSSVQELCSKLNDAQVNRDSVHFQAVASQTRYHVYSQRCQGSTGIPNQPTVEGMKNFVCQIQARNGNAVSQMEAQNIPVNKFGGAFTLQAPAYSCRVNKWGFQFCQYSSIARVKVKYDAALVGSSTAMDKITMSTEGLDNDTAVSVSGFAGAETKIEITPQDSENDRTTLIATCRGVDTTVRSQLASTGLYQCKGEERSRGRVKTFNYVNQMSDVVNSGISVTNSVFVQSFGDEVNFSQALMNNFEDSNVSLKSSISSLASVKISKPNYSLKLECQPK